MHESRVLTVKVTNCEGAGLHDDAFVQGILATCDMYGVLQHFAEIFGSNLLTSSCICNRSYADCPRSQFSCYAENPQAHESHESLRLEFASKRHAEQVRNFCILSSLMHKPNKNYKYRLFRSSSTILKGL